MLQQIPYAKQAVDRNKTRFQGGVEELKLQ